MLMSKSETEKQDVKNYGVITKRIGATKYTINVHFSNTSKENIKDKVLRLIRNDIAQSA